MASSNPVTGDKLISKPASKAYSDNYDAIFGKKEPKPEPKDKK